MIIISDTTPLRYLIQIEKVDILEKLFGKIIIPEKVAEELQRAKTPQKVKDLIQSNPAWLEIRKADLSVFTPQKRIDDGEREAFALAIELNADAVLLDDKSATSEAERLSLKVIPTFTILEGAAESGLIDLRQTIDDIRKTSFRLPPEDEIQAMFERDRKRQESQEAS